jgi:chemotaxis protein MotB
MRISHSLGVIALGLLATGCVSQEKYNALRLERDGLNEQLARAQSDSTAAQAKAASWKAQLDQVMQGNGGMAGLVTNLQQQNSSLQAQLTDITGKYNDALGRIGAGSPLPADLTNQLTTFADQNPDLVEFDAKKGTVKFKSDLTFNSGDATVQQTANAAIDKFATILNSPAARGYELLVCGHADNQKVSPGTVARGHKDNWYLSSHRALSVAEALQKDGVEAKRIGAVGYGEFRPVASNDSKQGMQQNRRVEVLILPQQIADSSPTAGGPANANLASDRKVEKVDAKTASKNNEDAALNK